MIIFRLSYKNVTETWWRSFALGSFVFLATVLLLFFNSFITTMQANLHDSMRNSLSGDVQIRPGSSQEGDMFSLKGSWGDVVSFSNSDSVKIQTALQHNDKAAEFTKRIRQNVLLANGTHKQGAMLIGLDLNSKVYQNSFKLASGNYLDPSKSDQVLISKTYAEKLNVQAGDKIDILAQTKDKQPVKITRTVAGIGDVERLASFSFYPVYIDLKGAAELIGFKDNEVTDVIVYIPDSKKLATAKSDIAAALQAEGLGKGDAKISTISEMGGFIQSIIDIYVGVFYAFIAILLVIMTLLIINLIFMMGLERRHEIGTLRSLGFSRFQIICIFMGEVSIITAMFFLAGLISGLALILILAKVGIRVAAPMNAVLGDQFFMQFDAMQIIPVIVIIFGFTLLASLYPSFKSASIRPAETLREI